MSASTAYSIDQVAEMTNLSRDTIEREIARGNLKARRVGRRYIIPERWYQEWLHREPKAEPQKVRQQNASRSAARPARDHSTTPLPAVSDIEQLRAQLRQARQSAKTSTGELKKKP